MSLTGWPLFTVVAVLFGVFTLGAIGDLPKLRAPRLLKRVVTVVLSQVCAILLVLLALNDWGEFYGSWTDLVGGGNGDVATVVGDGKSVGAGLPGSMALTRWSSQDELPSKGGVFEFTVKGAVSHLSTQALIFLPPQYFQAGHRHDRFPVVETVAGYPGDVPQLVNRLGYPAAENAALRRGTASPMILVMMKPTLVPPRDTECVDVPRGPQTLTFFSKDVPTVLKHALRTTSTGWGAMGHSTGGYCAAKLAMTNPTQFSAAVSLSGYFTTHEDQTTGNLFGGRRQLQNESDLVWRLKHLPVPNVAILASIGQDEGGAEGVPNNRQFIEAVKTPMIAQLKIIDGGGHNFGTYQRVLPDAYQWLSLHMHH